METVGFIGLGNMGGPVAGHIQRAGFPMVVYDLRPEVVRPFQERGATVASSAAELAGLCDVIITALPMPQDIEQVARQLVDDIKPGAIYIDISTGPPALILKLEPIYAAKGAHVLDAPVASGQPGAARGIHEIMVGGAPDIFERAKPVLDARGITTVAEVSMGPDWELQQIQLAKTKYRITHGIVIQLGTNGSVTQAQYDAVLAEVADIPRVVMMTVKAPKPWIDGNNEIIRSLPATHPNVVVLDWQARAEEISSHMSNNVDGGVHLSDDTAKQFYRDIILDALGLPT